MPIILPETCRQEQPIEAKSIRRGLSHGLGAMPLHRDKCGRKLGNEAGGALARISGLTGFLNVEPKIDNYRRG
jgi:hypothetical protein